MKTVSSPTYNLSVDDSMVNVDCSSTAVVLRLPRVASAVTVKKTDATANVVYITPYDGELINGTRQVETATVAGTVTVAGNVAVVTTGAYITDSPITTTVPVLAGDTASQVAAAIKNRLWQDHRITDKYVVSGSGVYIILTAKDYLANDATLNVSVDNSTSEGVTQATTSANTATGVPVTLATQNEYVTLVQTPSGWTVVDTGGVNKTETLANKTLTAPILTNPQTKYTVNTHSYASGHVDWTLSAAELLIPVHKTTLADSGANAIIPLTTSIPYTIINASGQAITVIGASGSGTAIANNKTATVMSDGTNVIRLTPDA